MAPGPKWMAVSDVYLILDPTNSHQAYLESDLDRPVFVEQTTSNRPPPSALTGLGAALHEGRHGSAVGWVFPVPRFRLSLR